MSHASVAASPHMRPRKQNRSRSALHVHKPASSPNRPLRPVRDLKNEADKLFEEARSAPDSEASQMVRALIVSGIHAAEAVPYREGSSEIEIGRERRRQLVNRRPTGEFIAEGRRTKARARKLENMLDDVLDAVASAAEGKMDPSDVYNRISEILGFRSPLVPLVERGTDSPPMGVVPAPKDESLNR